MVKRNLLANIYLLVNRSTYDHFEPDRCIFQHAPFSFYFSAAKSEDNSYWALSIITHSSISKLVVCRYWTEAAQTSVITVQYCNYCSLWYEQKLWTV